MVDACECKRINGVGKWVASFCKDVDTRGEGICRASIDRRVNGLGLICQFLVAAQIVLRKGKAPVPATRVRNKEKATQQVSR